MSWTNRCGGRGGDRGCRFKSAGGEQRIWHNCAPPEKEMSLPGMVEGVRGSPTIKRPVAFDNMTSPFDVDASVSNLVHCRLIAVLRG